MRFLLPLLCLAVLLSACKAQTGGSGPQSVALIGPDDQAITVAVEVADAPEEWEQGLKGREALQEGHGMIFIFPISANLNFWMKDTLIPLDIIYFGPQGKVVDTKSMEPCGDQDPCPQYTSVAPAQYALEVPAGFLAKTGVGSGWQLALPLK